MSFTITTERRKLRDTKRERKTRNLKRPHTGGTRMQPSKFQRWMVSTIVALSSVVLCNAQASPAIQFFLPDGSLPPRELRFTMAIDNGRIETFFTDSKGKFLLTRLL